ncbi:MAG: hypothetical protein U0531_17270 [Dehalococcoidia bacterium]
MAVALDIEIRLLRPTDAKQVADLLAVGVRRRSSRAPARRRLYRASSPHRWLVAARLPPSPCPAAGCVLLHFFVAASRGIVGSTSVMGSRLPLINASPYGPSSAAAASLSG